MIKPKSQHPSPRRSHEQMIKETTAKLIQAARHSFATVGYAATSMDELCAEVGLTRGALYHHFGGKEGLFETVVKQIDHEIVLQIEAVWQLHTDPWVGFQACCEAYLSLALVPEIQRIVLQEAPAILGMKLKTIDELSSIKPLIEGLQMLMSSGYIQDGDPDALAHLLNGALTNAALWIAASAAPSEAHIKAQQSLKQLLNGLHQT